MNNLLSIYTDGAHPESHNYFSVTDIVPRLTAHDISLFLLQLHEGMKLGLTAEQRIDQLIQNDIEIFIDTQDKKTIDTFRKQRLQYYNDKLRHVSNITVLDEGGSRAWEHAFLAPCYQKILKEIICKYK